MASCGDQKHLLKQPHIEFDDQLLRDRSLSMPASAKENIPVVRRRTIFDPPINIFSPEENTSDYLEDYIENLGEYHVYRDTRHLHSHTPLQFGANSEKNLALCPIENTLIKEEPKRNQESSIKVENTLSEELKTIKDGKSNDGIKTIDKKDSEHPSNRSPKRSFQLQELKICHSNKEKQSHPASAPICSSQIQTVNSAPISSKDVPKSLNAMKPLTSKKIHVDAPKPIEKGFTIDICPSNENLIEMTPRHQKNTNKLSPNRNIAKSTRDISLAKSTRDISCNPPKQLPRGQSTEERSHQMTSRILKIPRPPEVDGMAIGTDISQKRMSVAKTSPKPARKGPKSKSTMHSFFEAFM